VKRTHVPDIFWIEELEGGRIGIMPRPRGGDWLGDELTALAKSQVEVLVSLLTTDEIVELELRDEERLCAEHGIRFVSFPIPDRGIPSSIPEATRTIDFISEELRSGKTVAVHCRMGIGRSALIVACLLASKGIAVDEAFTMISRARGFEVPDTEQQRVWVTSFVESRRSAPATGRQPTTDHRQPTTDPSPPASASALPRNPARP
jgi:protein-tyrosine phosphatase